MQSLILRLLQSPPPTPSSAGVQSLDIGSHRTGFVCLLCHRNILWEGPGFQGEGHLHHSGSVIPSPPSSPMAFLVSHCHVATNAVTAAPPSRSTTSCWPVTDLNLTHLPHSASTNQPPGSPSPEQHISPARSYPTRSLRIFSVGNTHLSWQRVPIKM